MPKSNKQGLATNVPSTKSGSDKRMVGTAVNGEHEINVEFSVVVPILNTKWCLHRSSGSTLISCSHSFFEMTPSCQASEALTLGVENVNNDVNNDSNSVLNRCILLGSARYYASENLTESTVVTTLLLTFSTPRVRWAWSEGRYVNACLAHGSIRLAQEFSWNFFISNKRHNAMFFSNKHE